MLEIRELNCNRQINNFCSLKKPRSNTPLSLYGTAEIFWSDVEKVKKKTR